MLKKTVTLLATLVMIPTAAALAQPVGSEDGAGSWIHVRVDEPDGTQVSLNLPLSMVDVAFQIAETNGFDESDLRLDPDGDVQVEDLRRMWRELENAGDADFVDIRDGDEHVRVFRRGDQVHVHIDEDGRKTVRIEMPPRIVDALLGSEGNRLDLPAAARELGRSGKQEMVRIDDDGTRVRIWVDRNSSGE
jgi:hypothetical protein